MIIAYPFRVINDAGAPVSGATVTITSVLDEDGNAIASHGATVKQSGANGTVRYDAEAKGEAWITLAISKGGETFTGLNAAPSIFAAKDSSRVVTALPNAAAGGSGGLATSDKQDTLASYVDTEVAAIKAKTDNLPAAPAAVGDIPTVLQIDTQLSGAHGAGSWDAVNADPLESAVPGAYAAGTAGYNLGLIDEVKAKTDLITNSGSVTIISPIMLEGTEMTGLRGDQWEQPITDIGDISGRTKLWFTVKRSLADADADAILQIIEGTGLTVLNGASTGFVAGDASIVVDDENAGDLTLTVESAVTSLLETGQSWAWDIQILPGVSTKVQGTLIVTGDVTQAIS